MKTIVVYAMGILIFVLVGCSNGENAANKQGLAGEQEAEHRTMYSVPITGTLVKVNYNEIVPDGEDVLHLYIWNGPPDPEKEESGEEPSQEEEAGTSSEKWDMFRVEVPSGGSTELVEDALLELGFNQIKEMRIKNRTLAQELNDREESDGMDNEGTATIPIYKFNKNQAIVHDVVLSFIRASSITEIERPIDERILAGYLVTEENEKIVILYFHNMSNRKLYRPGCDELYQFLGLENKDIHVSTDPRSILGKYWVSAEDSNDKIDVIGIPCGMGKNGQNSQLKWHCADMKMEQEKRKTMDALLENISGAANCEKVEAKLAESAESLSLADRGLSDLSILQYLSSKNIKEIDLSGNNFEDKKDLEYLKNFEGLTTLKLSRNDLNEEDLERVLYSYQNGYRTIAFKDLQILDLSSNRITSLSFLEDYLRLQDINLQGNQLTDNEICDDKCALCSMNVSQIRQLKSINLNDNQIVCLDPLRSASRLEKLFARNNKIREIGHIFWDENGNASLTKLQEVDLSNDVMAQGNEVRDIRKVHLYYLDKDKVEKKVKVLVGNNPIDYMRNFQDWIDHQNNFQEDGRNRTVKRICEELWGEENCSVKESDFSDINVEKLSLYNTGIRNISPITAFTGLKKLQIAENDIKDAGPLRALKVLEWLDMSGNQISDMSWIQETSEVRKIFARGNQIKFNRETLCPLKNLDTLDLSYQVNVIATEKSASDRETKCGVDDTLTHLNLSGTNVDQIKDDIFYFQGLTHLFLRNTKTVNGTEILSELTNLKHLDLSKNFIQEISAVGNETLKSIDLSECNLQKMGHMGSADYIDLEGNALQGRESLPRHSGLTYLDLRDAMASNDQTSVCDDYDDSVDCYE